MGILGQPKDVVFRQHSILYELTHKYTITRVFTMAIVEIKKSIRPNTSVEVFNRSTDPVRIAQKQATKDLLGDEVVLINEGSHKKFSY